MTAVAALRKGLNLTQEAFAKSLRSSQSEVSLVERGKPPSRDLGLAIWRKYAKELEAIGASLEDVLTSRRSRRRWVQRDDGDGAAA